MKKIILVGFLCINISSYSQVTNGLQGHWLFDGDAMDVSGNNNHGTVQGATLSKDRHNQDSMAYCFDGIDDYIVTAFSGIAGTQSRTITFWAKIDSLGNIPNSNGYEVITYGETSAGNAGESFRVILNRACTGMGSSAGLSTFTLSNSMPSLDVWHYFTLVYDANISNQMGDFLYYIDGNLVSNTHCDSYNTTTLVNTITDMPIHFGRLYSPTQPRWFKGCLDDVRMYNRALTSLEIDTLYNLTPVSIIEEKNRHQKVKLFPNPTSKLLTIDYSRNDIKELIVLNILGEEILKSNKPINNSINVSSIPSGLYILRIINNKNEKIDSKFIKAEE